ncbi:MAG: hypothetical protein CMM61_08660 [Rhodospirillaceae bacterium]|nr:hypothetical protein [Rhodospirillaceae bacterium]
MSRRCRPTLWIGDTDTIGDTAAPRGGLHEDDRHAKDTGERLRRQDIAGNRRENLGPTRKQAICGMISPIPPRVVDRRPANPVLLVK